MFKRIVAFVFALVCCVGVFGVFSMTNREPVAYADSVVTTSTFVGSDLCFPISYRSDSSANLDLSSSRFSTMDDGLTQTTFNVTFEVDSDSNFHINLHGVFCSFTPLFNLYSFQQFDTDVSVSLSDFPSGNASLQRFVQSRMNVYQVNSYYYTGFTFNFYKPSTATSFPSFDNLTTFCLGNYNDGYYGNRIYNYSQGYYNYLRYEFTDNWSFMIGIPSCPSNVNSMTDYNYFSDSFLDFRRYYFLDNADLSDNSYYQQGVADGNSVGYQSGYDYGYEKGILDGKTIGYGQGLEEGVQVSGYSFLDLFGSVLDAPVKVILNLLNFEIFGFNMWNLFTGLITLAFVIFVIKLVLGGR